MTVNGDSNSIGEILSPVDQFHTKGESIMQIITLLVRGLLLCCIVVVTGCKNDSTGPTQNTPPVIVRVTATPRVIAVGGVVNLSCTASDQNGDRLAYVWAVEAGAISGSGPTVAWHMPNFVGRYKVSVVVNDSSGGIATDSIYVRVSTQDTLIKAIVIRSDGNNYPSYWNYLNANWNRYGTARIIVDYLSFDHQNITLPELLASNADVIIIDDARNPQVSEILTQAEVSAIGQYVQGSHGVIITGGTLRPVTHSPFVSLMGFSQQAGGQVYFGETQPDSIVITDPQTQLFRNISSYTTASRNFYSGSDWNHDGIFGYPNDWNAVLTSTKARPVAFIWNLNHLTNHLECSLISYIEAPIYRGVFAGHRASSLIATTDDYQFYYNAIVFCGR